MKTEVEICVLDQDRTIPKSGLLYLKHGNLVTSIHGGAINIPGRGPITRLIATTNKPIPEGTSYYFELTTGVPGIGDESVHLSAPLLDLMSKDGATQGGLSFPGEPFQARIRRSSGPEAQSNFDTIKVVLMGPAESTCG